MEGVRAIGLEKLWALYTCKCYCVNPLVWSLLQTNSLGDGFLFMIQRLEGILQKKIFYIHEHACSLNSKLQLQLQSQRSNIKVKGQTCYGHVCGFQNLFCKIPSNLCMQPSATDVDSDCYLHI